MNKNILQDKPIWVTVKEAAKLLNMTEQKVRVGMEKGTLPIGIYYKNGERGTFNISRAKLERYINEIT